MPFLSRTQEFQQIFSLKRQSHLQYRPTQKAKVQDAPKHSNFYVEAKGVSKDLQYTVEMLEQLTKREYFLDNEDLKE
mgnify:CR=1 FL=1